MSETLKIPQYAIYDQPVTLTDSNGQPINFDGTLYFMVKEKASDEDSEAIISKQITIVNTDGDPYHGIISFTIDDTSKPAGKYVYGFKTGLNETWLPSTTGIATIVESVVHKNE